MILKFRLARRFVFLVFFRVTMDRSRSVRVGRVHYHDGQDLGLFLLLVVMVGVFVDCSAVVGCSSDGWIEGCNFPRVIFTASHSSLPR
jgi:hypothetical protein